MSNKTRGNHSRDRMVVGFMGPMQSASITTNVVSSNPAQTSCIYHYVITIISDFQQFGAFLRFPPPIYTEILLKVVFNTITITPSNKTIHGSFMHFILIKVKCLFNYFSYCPIKLFQGENGEH